jgi:predicted membrane channel-forming protein YqfA (hemolysin III family)
MTEQRKIEKRLRLAGSLIFVGLAIQLGTFLVNHPLSFMAFIFVGSPLVVAGAVMYLVGVVLQSQG